ncbi:MAG: hypothetical protein [Phage AS32]|nr:MAG: hypothetical protein [Phage AS32]
MYLGLFLSGAFALYDPPQLIESQTTAKVVTAWAAGMIISSLMCLYSSVTDRWIGEYSGLPLLFSVLGLFGFAVLWSALELNSVPVCAYSFVILAFASGLVARWQDIREVKVNAEELGEQSDEE